MRHFDRITRWLSAALLATVVALFVAMAALNGAEAVARYAFQASSIYLVEASLVVGTAVYFVGYTVLLERDEDIRMSYFVQRMAPASRKVLDVLTELGVLTFFVVLGAATWSYYDLTSRMSHSLFPFPQGWVVLPLLVGTLACLWVAVHRLLTALRRAFGGARDAA